MQKLKLIMVCFVGLLSCLSPITVQIEKECCLWMIKNIYLELDN